MPSLFLCAFLWLVNCQNPLPADYVPPDLITYNHVRIDPHAHEAFINMLAAMREDNIYGLHLYSAYRSYERQADLFHAKVRQFTQKGYTQTQAEQLASREVQRPGASEHQLGLALDVSTTGQLTEAFGETKAGLWLANHAHLFGFIIRYPEDKTHITQIIYEPWHIRYVGTPHAQIIFEHGLVLEEYAAFLMAHPLIAATVLER